MDVVYYWVGLVTVSLVVFLAISRFILWAVLKIFVDAETLVAVAKTLAKKVKSHD